MKPNAETEPAPLEYLRIVAEAATILENEPDSPGALRRRDDMVLTALRHHPPREVAEAARISAEEMFELVAASLPQPRRRPRPERRREQNQALAGSITSVRRMLFPEGSRKPESMP